jgi:6-pyruvoyltetrahydropterin/6-carboxytetrahydropterin synthase
MPNKILVTKEFKFSSAHFLTQYYGKCEHLHGHNYKLAVTIEGHIFENGLVVDFAILKKIVKEKIIDKLDHQNLNDFFKNPSAENIAMWIWNELKDFSTLLKKESDFYNVKLYKIKLWETENNYVTIKI